MDSSKSANFSKLTVFEIVFIAVVSVALGVSYWGWTFVYEFSKPFLKIYGLNYLSSGFWILASVMLSSIIRKPGVALLASLIAAGIETMITQWGMMSLVWGLVQGLGAELVFLLFMYKKWDFYVLVLAAIVSSIFSYTLDYFYYGYGQATLTINIVQVSSFIISSILLAAVLSNYLVKRLLKIGLLNNFLVSKKHSV